MVDAPTLMKGAIGAYPYSGKRPSPRAYTVGSAPQALPIGAVGAWAHGDEVKPSNRAVLTRRRRLLS
jgi:hypothetical protein